MTNLPDAPTLAEWFDSTEEQSSKWYDDHNVGRTYMDADYAKPEFTLSFASEAAYDQWWIDYEYSDQLECIAIVRGRDGSLVATVTPQI